MAKIIQKNCPLVIYLLIDINVYNAKTPLDGAIIEQNKEIDINYNIIS